MSLAFLKKKYGVYIIMKFVCTNNTELKTNLKGALFNPIPIKDGLWIPNKIDKLPKTFFENIHNMSFKEIAYIIANQLIGEEIPSENLKNIVDVCFNFKIPLYKLSENLHILELFHGPTMTFKDIGARFMSEVIKYFIKDDKIDIIVSTSGDTGSAVADAFYNIPNIKVHILYPKNKISKIQEFQITNYGKNIIPYEVEGNFDNCQQIIKDTLADKEVSKIMKLFPANSINIARLIPQSFYYFWLYSQLKKQNMNIKDLYVAIPSGNLGNLTGGIIAYKMGLPIEMFIGATNDNKAFSEYLYNNQINIQKVFHTISNAMDIGIPNNLIRLRSIFGDNINMQKKISSFSITESETKNTIEEVYKKFNYTLDPHTAVGYKALEKYLLKNNIKSYTGVVLSTAHPSKFPEVMEKLDVSVSIPSRISNLKKNGIKYNISLNYDIWKTMLIKSKNFKNVSLIGMPGTGKSYISKSLSIKNGWKLIEIDNIIENKYGQELSIIIKKYGNKYFKNIEEKITIQQTGKGNNNIFSTGGSIIYSDNAMKHLQDISLIIYLNTSVNTIIQRIGNPKKRGIVLEDNETIKSLYYKRSKLYEKYYHIQINCDKYNENEICQQIMIYLKKYFS